MDDNAIKKVADMLSTYSYKVDALVDVLIKNNIVTKEEINESLISVMEASEKQPATDEYVIEKLKEKILVR
ncbi:hypothetical protein CSC2_25570 [Clostridium zeae]|uniref:Uncharacterized protein n=1 Tax=Clostridium zeae TaxID=2759022 RepID=A0ABQ1EBI4_9CLOT|nr:hypothetical protein [Clostridium zeae]GFZ32031.1 hypothetical protein CSC2_25570 [Clostridium zeae]